MPQFEVILATAGNGIGRLTLNRPESLNAFNEKMTEEMQEALKSFANDKSIRCVAVTGSGRAFSAGQDLKEVAPGKSFGDSLRRRYNPIIRLIAEMEKPVVALVNGVAAGAGMSLALACDFKIMSASARMFQAFVKIGLVPDSGSTYFLPRLVGYTRAFELAALGNDITAEEALRLGIVNRVFPDDRFAEESGKILLQFANGPTKAYSYIKRMLKHSMGSSLEQSLEYEAYMQEIAGGTEDAREATKAIVEKRAPSYKGK